MQSRLLGAGSSTSLQNAFVSCRVAHTNKVWHYGASRCGLVRCHSAASSNGDAAESIEDNADSGLGKLRFNKRVS